MQIFIVDTPNGYTISDERSRIDMGFVHAALADAYWSVDRPARLTDRSWANCLCFGVYEPEGTQVGFARILTDYALRAHVGDVFVHPAARGLGLGKALMEAIMRHPELATVSHWTLTTADAHDLYARYGFRSPEPDPDWMTLVRAPQPGGYG